MDDDAPAAGAAAVDVSEPQPDGGAFGTWATDEYGLPLYRFTLDQTVDQTTAKNYRYTSPRPHRH